MTDKLDVPDIAADLGLNRKYVADVVVHRPDFPRPVVRLSRKTRRWSREEYERWKQANRPTR